MWLNCYQFIISKVLKRFQNSLDQNSENIYIQSSYTWIKVTATWLLTHSGRVMHIYVGNQTMIDSDNDLSPGWRQTIIWINAGILSIGPLGTNFKSDQFIFFICLFSMTKGIWIQYINLQYCILYYEVFSMSKWCFVIFRSCVLYLHYELVPAPGSHAPLSAYQHHSRSWFDIWISYVIRKQNML